MGIQVLVEMGWKGFLDNDIALESGQGHPSSHVRFLRTVCQPMSMFKSSNFACAQ